jgi:hypothetical protein
LGNRATDPAFRGQCRGQCHERLEFAQIRTFEHVEITAPDQLLRPLVTDAIDELPAGVGIAEHGAERETHLVRDLDLAQQAGLADPHKIRGVVRKCAEDKLFAVGETIPLAERNGAALAVPEVVPIGSGSKREVIAYYPPRPPAPCCSQLNA